jgi:hypothetical protein
VIPNAIAEKLKRQSKNDLKGRRFEAWLIIQAVSWYMRYPLSYRNIEEMFFIIAKIFGNPMSNWCLL